MVFIDCILILTSKCNFEDWFVFLSIISEMHKFGSNNMQAMFLWVHESSKVYWIANQPKIRYFATKEQNITVICPYFGSLTRGDTCPNKCLCEQGSNSSQIPTPLVRQRRQRRLFIPENFSPTSKGFTRKMFTDNDVFFRRIWNKQQKEFATKWYDYYSEYLIYIDSIWIDERRQSTQYNRIRSWTCWEIEILCN